MYIIVIKQSIKLNTTALSVKGEKYSIKKNPTALSVQGEKLSIIQHLKENRNEKAPRALSTGME